jgi:hypothetical protein
MSVVDIVDEAQLTKLSGSSSFCVVHFYADWAKPCAALNKVLFPPKQTSFVLFHMFFFTKKGFG